MAQPGASSSTLPGPAEAWNLRNLSLPPQDVQQERHEKRKRKIGECLDEHSSEQVPPTKRLPTGMKEGVRDHLEKLDEEVLKNGSDVQNGLADKFGYQKWMFGLVQTVESKFKAPE
eukprot:2044986-Amphidinium_carterae.1